jgi:hypothetical protein
MGSKTEPLALVPDYGPSFTLAKNRSGMPRYYFDLKNSDGTLLDPDGTELLDEAAAREHARHVMLELMRNASVRTRMWRLTISDQGRMSCFECLFASHDDSIAHLRPELRSSVETVCHEHGALADAIVDVRTTILQIRDTLARSDAVANVAARL